MRTIADHLYDIAMNSVKAGAKNVYVSIREDTDKNEFYFSVKDDGSGISEEKLIKVFDPFYTTRDKKIRKVGLGLPLLKQNTEITGGYTKISSKENEGTYTEALFYTNNIDAIEKGDIAGSVHGLVVSSDQIDWYIKIEKNELKEEISTLEIRDALGGLSFQNIEVMQALMNIFREIAENIGI